MSENTVYIISGPLGVGKSSVSREIALQIIDGVVVEGDVFFLALEDDETITWEKRLQLSLNAIIETTKNHQKSNLNVVIDFAAEVGPTWFQKQFLDLNVIVKYVVLVTDEKTLALRLAERGDSKYLSRSLTLLEKLKTASENQKYLLDVTNKTVIEVAQEIIDEEVFVAK